MVWSTVQCVLIVTVTYEWICTVFMTKLLIKTMNLQQTQVGGCYRLWLSPTAHKLTGDKIHTHSLSRGIGCFAAYIMLGYMASWQLDGGLCAKFEAEAPIHFWTAYVQPINLKKMEGSSCHQILLWCPTMVTNVLKSMGHTWRTSPKPNISTVYNFCHFSNDWQGRSYCDQTGLVRQIIADKSSVNLHTGALPTQRQRTCSALIVKKQKKSSEVNRHRCVGF